MIRSRLLWHFFAHYLQVALFFIAGAALLGYLAVFTEFARQAGGAPGYSLGANVLLSLLKMPFLMQSFIPFIVLFASMTSLILLNRAEELVIARSAGLSAWQFLAPLCALSFLIGVATVVVLSPATARINAQALEMERSILNGAPRVFSTQGTRWLTQRTGDGVMVIGARGFANDEGQLDGVTVLRLDADNRFVARLDADRGVLEAGELRLETVRQLDASGEREALPAMVVPTQIRSENLARQFTNADAAHIFELPGLIETARTLGLPMNGFATRLHALLALPFLLIAMTLIAAAVSIKFSRSGQSSSAAVVGIAAGFVFYIVSTVAAASGSAGALPPAVAAWLPIIVAGCLSVVSLLHTEDG